MNRRRVEPPEYKEPLWTSLCQHALRPQLPLSLETLSNHSHQSHPGASEVSLLPFVGIFAKLSNATNKYRKNIRGHVYIETVLMKHLIKTPEIHRYAQTLPICCSTDVLLIRFIVILTENWQVQLSGLLFWGVDNYSAVLLSGLRRQRVIQLLV